MRIRICAARGAAGAGDQHVVGLHRFDRGRRAHDDDEDGREGGVGDLLRKADAEDQDEHRQEDRFRHAEHIEQHRLEDLAEIVVLRRQHADRRAERHGDDEGHDHFERRDADRLVHLRRGRACLTSIASTSRQRRQQARDRRCRTRGSSCPGGQDGGEQRQPRGDDLSLVMRRSSCLGRHRLEGRRRRSARPAPGRSCRSACAMSSARSIHSLVNSPSAESFLRLPSSSAAAMASGISSISAISLTAASRFLSSCRKATPP